MAPEPAHFSPGEKLGLVRELDIFHPWDSLDEKRYCRRCGGIFTGHEIKVIAAGDGANYRLECPTDGCPSVPIEWIMLEPSKERVLLRPDLQVEFSHTSPPARYPQYRPGLFGFLRVPQAF
jgi:hypothetical protein